MVGGCLYQLLYLELYSLWVQSLCVELPIKPSQRKLYKQAFLYTSGMCSVSLYKQ